MKGTKIIQHPLRRENLITFKVSVFAENNQFRSTKKIVQQFGVIR